MAVETSWINGHTRANSPLTAMPPAADDWTETPWSVARQALTAAYTYWLATVQPDGATHQMPILAIWQGEAAYFCAAPESRKARNLARTPACVITTDSESLHLVVEGRAHRLRDAAALAAIAAAYSAKYDWRVGVCDGALHTPGTPAGGAATYHVYRVTPAVVFGFRLDGAVTPMRWRFDRA